VFLLFGFGSFVVLSNIFLGFGFLTFILGGVTGIGHDRAETLINMWCARVLRENHMCSGIGGYRVLSSSCLFTFELAVIESEGMSKFPSSLC